MCEFFFYFLRENHRVRGEVADGVVRTAGPRLPPGPAVILTRFCQLLLLRPCPECGRNRSVRTCPERQDSPCHAGPRRELIARAVSSRQQTGPQSPREETSVPRPPRRGCARRWWGRAGGRGSGAAPAWAGPVRAGSHPPRPPVAALSAHGDAATAAAFLANSGAAEQRPRPPLAAGPSVPWATRPVHTFVAAVDSGAPGGAFQPTKLHTRPHLGEKVFAE